MAHIKIRVGLHTGLSPYEVTTAGLKFNDTFLNTLYDYEEYFRSKILLPINEFIGDEWHLFFTEYLFPYQGFFADIYAGSEYEAKLIKTIIEEKLTAEFKFLFYYKGPLGLKLEAEGCTV